MESMVSENGLYIGLAVVGCLMLFLFFLQAWLLKFSVRICGGDDIGLMRGFAVLSSIATVSIAVAVGFLFLLPGQSQAMAGLCSLAAVILVMCVMLQMGPIRAFGVYLVHSLLSGISGFAVVVLLLVGAKFAIPGEKLEAFAADLKTRIESQEQFASAMKRSEGVNEDAENLESINGWLNGSEVQETAPNDGFQPVRNVDFSALEELQSLLGSGTRTSGNQATVGEDPAAPAPKRLPIPPASGTVRTNPFAEN